MDNQDILTPLPVEQRPHLDSVMHVPISELAVALVRETKQFLDQQEFDERIGLTLFRLALAHHNQAAWEVVYQQYAPLVLTWVTQHQSATSLLVQDGSGPLVNAAFAKFSQALTPAKMAHFDSLAAILKYLKMCVHSVVADEVRARQTRQYEEALELVEDEPAADDPADDVVANISALALWQIILEELNGEDEHVLVYLALVQDWKPGEICRNYPRLFPTVDDVYRIKRNVWDRLKRNRSLRRLIHDDAA